jgi:hypothetical protein
MSEKTSLFWSFATVDHSPTEDNFRTEIMAKWRRTSFCKRSDYVAENRETAMSFAFKVRRD